MIKELGELSQVVMQGKTRKEIFEENIDLMNLVLGNFVSRRVSLKDIDAFWKKTRKGYEQKNRDNYLE